MSNARNLANLLTPGVTATLTPIVTLTATGSCYCLLQHAGKILLMGEVGAEDAAAT